MHLAALAQLPNLVDRGFRPSDAIFRPEAHSSRHLVPFRRFKTLRVAAACSVRPGTSAIWPAPHRRQGGSAESAQTGKGANCCQDVVPLQSGRLYFSEDRSASIATEGRLRLTKRVRRHRPSRRSNGLQRRGSVDGFEIAVYMSQLVEPETAGGGRRWRRRPPVPSYGWHLIHAERPLTWCGLEFSYAYSQRRLWSETPEDHRCQSCSGRLRRMSRPDTNQRTA